MTTNEIHDVVMAASDNILQGGGGGQEKADPNTTSDPIYAPVRQRWVINQNYFVMLETFPSRPGLRLHLSI